MTTEYTLNRYIPDRGRKPQPDEGAPRTSCPQGLSRKARLVAIPNHSEISACYGYEKTAPFAARFMNYIYIFSERPIATQTTASPCHGSRRFLPAWRERLSAFQAAGSQGMARSCSTARYCAEIHLEPYPCLQQFVKRRVRCSAVARA